MRLFAPAVVLVFLFSGCAVTRTIGDLCTTAKWLSATADALCALRDTSHTLSPEVLEKAKALESRLDSLYLELKVQAREGSE